MLKTLASQIKEYKKASIATPIFMILEVIMETIIPLMMASIIDDGVSVGNAGHIYKMGALMLAAACFSLFSGFMGGKYGARASTGFARNLRKAMYENIQTFSFSNIDKFSTAGLVTRLTTDVTNIQNAYQMLLRMCMRAPFSLICAMVMSFAVNTRIATIYLIAVLVLGVILGVLITRTTKYFRSIFQKYDDLNESVQENVSAIRVVKAYVREDHEKEKFTKASGNVYKLFTKAEAMICLNMPIMQFTVYTCILVISWMGAHMIVSNTLTTGGLSMLLTYCMNILMNLMMLSMIFVMVTMSVASARRVAEVLNEKPDITNPENPVMEVADGSIEFRHVDFSYKKDAKEPVLKDINLKIRSGETIGIIGGTGSAKTSLVNLISRLYDVTKGEVLVGGRNVKDYDMEVLRNQVSVVLQNNVLFSGTILDNLRWGDKEATLEECRHACELACADEFIDRFPKGYETYIEQGGSNVSGGQKQRLCIARALAVKPEVLLMDEPTSALDPISTIKIEELAQELKKDYTIVMVTHNMQQATRISDKTVFFLLGEIIEAGKTDELFSMPKDKRTEDYITGRFG